MISQVINSIPNLLSHVVGMSPFKSLAKRARKSEGILRLLYNYSYIRRRHRAHPRQDARQAPSPTAQANADKGYDYRHLCLAWRLRRIIPRIARCGVEPKNRLGP